MSKVDIPDQHTQQYDNQDDEDPHFYYENGVGNPSRVDHLVTGYVDLVFVTSIVMPNGSRLPLWSVLCI